MSTEIESKRSILFYVGAFGLTGFLGLLLGLTLASKPADLKPSPDMAAELKRIDANVAFVFGMVTNQDAAVARAFATQESYIRNLTDRLTALEHSNLTNHPAQAVTKPGK